MTVPAVILVGEFDVDQQLGGRDRADRHIGVVAQELVGLIRCARARLALRCRESVAPRITRGRIARRAPDLSKITFPVGVRLVRAHELAQLSQPAWPGRCDEGDRAAAADHGE
jgi:hypothetical protein